MYPSKFEYVAVESVTEAISALETYEDAELIAGGQSLVPLQKTRFASPDHLIDLTEIEGLEYVRDGGDAVEIGALASHTKIQHAEPVRDHVPLFSECIGQIADWPVRNQGTFGGTVAEADPSGDYLPVLQVLNPEFTVAGPDGERTLPFEDFYLGMFTVDMDDEEVLVEGRLPKLGPDVAGTAVGSTYQKHAERSGDYAVAGVAAIVAIDEAGVVTEARLSIGAVGPLTRPSAVEDVVTGTTMNEEILEEAAAATRESVVPDEEGREGEYKEAMAAEFTRRALETAHDRASEELES
jgi:carbon-monoxide dehydrogenase medium subunit